MLLAMLLGGLRSAEVRGLRHELASAGIALLALRALVPIWVANASIWSSSIRVSSA